MAALLLWLCSALALAGELQQASATRAQLETANADFTYRGPPIHPRAVEELLSWYADGVAGTVAIDLGGTFESNRYYGSFTRLDDGTVVFDRTANALDPPHPQANLGWFRYQRLGTLRGGLHVLRIWDNGGGTLTAGYLLLVHFALDEEYRPDGSKRVRLVMQRRGEIHLPLDYDGRIEVIDGGRRLRLGEPVRCCEDETESPARTLRFD